MDTKRSPSCAHLQRDHLFGHGPLHRLIHLRVLDPQATEDYESFQELLIIPVEWLHLAGVLLHLVHELANPCDDTWKGADVIGGHSAQ